MTISRRFDLIRWCTGNSLEWAKVGVDSIDRELNSLARIWSRGIQNDQFRHISRRMYDIHCVRLNSCVGNDNIDYFMARARLRNEWAKLCFVTSFLERNGQVNRPGRIYSELRLVSNVVLGNARCDSRVLEWVSGAKRAEDLIEELGEEIDLIVIDADMSCPREYRAAVGRIIELQRIQEIVGYCLSMDIRSKRPREALIQNVESLIRDSTNEQSR